MNRRGFFKRTIGALAAAYLAPLLPTPLAKSSGFVGPITFKGIPITYSQYCPNNTIYFLSKTAIWKLQGGDKSQLISGEWKTMT